MSEEKKFGIEKFLWEVYAIAAQNGSLSWENLRSAMICAMREPGAADITPFAGKMMNMWMTHDRKNADYDGSKAAYSNIRSCEKIGVPPHVGCWIRMNDKWSRIEALLNSEGGPAVVDESLQDTLMDLAVYSIIMSILLDEAT